MKQNSATKRINRAVTSLNPSNIAIGDYPCAPAPHIRAVPVRDHNMQFHPRFWMDPEGEKVGMIKQMNILASTFNTCGAVDIPESRMHPMHPNQLVVDSVAGHGILAQSYGRECRFGGTYADVIVSRFYLHDELKRLRILFLKEFRLISRVLRKYAKSLVMRHVRFGHQFVPAYTHRRHIMFPAPMKVGV